MKRARLQLEVVTPAFLGGAAPDEKAEWRAASVRGQWRWWFRALAGPRLGQDLAEVAEAESRIFGSTRAASIIQVRASPAQPPSRPAKTHLSIPDGRSAEQLATDWGIGHEHPDFAATEQRLRIHDAGGREVATSGVAYLGFGCIEYSGTVQRAYIEPQTELELTLQWRERDWGKLKQEWRAAAGLALQAWLLLGGIGTRSRKGFGSLHLKGVEGHLPDEFDLSVPRSSQQLESQIAPLLQADAPDSPPAWSQISKATRVYMVTGIANTWEDALDRVGGWLIAYRRRYGAATEARSGLEDRDYQWVFGDEPGEIPDRSGFGLPLPFGERDAPRVTARSAEGGQLRRASPLLIHLAPLAAGSFQPILAHLDGRFLPDGAQLQVGGQRGAPTQAQKDIVQHFLDDLVDKGKIVRICDG